MLRLLPLCLAAFLIYPLSASESCNLTSTTEVAFSPNGGAAQLVVTAISEAKTTIEVAAYAFTSANISAALVSAHDRGVDVRVFMDKVGSGKLGRADDLIVAGIPVRVDHRHAILHDKYIIIDDVSLELGSFNYTEAADHRNAENVLLLRGAPCLARQYKENWQVLWDESEG